MADSNMNDPAALWRDMVAQWEKNMNDFATQVMGTDEFSRDMNKVMSASMKMQKTTQEMLGRYFDALNLPTKDDIRGLGERLRSIEDQLTRVNNAVERLAGPTENAVGGAPPVPRTKRFRKKEAGQS